MYETLEIPRKVRFRSTTIVSAKFGLYCSFHFFTPFRQTLDIIDVCTIVNDWTLGFFPTCRVKCTLAWQGTLRTCRVCRTVAWTTRTQLQPGTWQRKLLAWAFMSWGVSRSAGGGVCVMPVERRLRAARRGVLRGGARACKSGGVSCEFERSVAEWQMCRGEGRVEASIAE